MKLFLRLYYLYLRHFKTEQWARVLGVSVGDYTKISSSTLFSSEPYLIKIGSHVQITPGVSFFTHGGGNSIREKYPEFDCFGKIVVGDWAYIGSHSLIMAGVTIGDGALVAAGSVVTKSVKPHTVVGGNPAHFICTIEEYVDKNMKFNVNTKGLTYDEKKKVLLSMPDDRFINK